MVPSFAVCNLLPSGQRNVSASSLHGEQNEESKGKLLRGSRRCMNLLSGGCFCHTYGAMTLALITIRPIKINLFIVEVLNLFYIVVQWATTMAGCKTGKTNYGASDDLFVAIK